MRHVPSDSAAAAVAVALLASACALPGRAGDGARAADAVAVVAPEEERAPSPVNVPAVALPEVAEGDLRAVELTTVGWDALSDAPVVLLREAGSGRLLPIWIGLAEAQAIGMALHGVVTPRPMTHDLMAKLLGELGGTLEEVVVVALRDATYFGLLKVRVEGQAEPRWIDTRPSDGLALALRTGAAIRVASGLLEDQPSYHFIAPDSPEQVVRALGLTVVAATPQLRERFALPERPGVVVLHTDGEAQRQGLRAGDLVIAVGDVVPEEPVDVLDAVAALAPGEPLVVTVWRDGEEVTVELSLARAEPPKPAVVV